MRNKGFHQLLGIKYVNPRLKEDLDCVKRKLSTLPSNANWPGKYLLIILDSGSRLLKLNICVNCGLFQYQSKPTDSPIWKNLLKCRNLLKQGIRWKIGRGNNISFWFANWVDNHNLIDLLGVPLATIPEPNAMVSDFINNGRSWNATKRQQYVQDHSVLLKIKGLDIPTNEIEDSFCWGPSSSRDFTTKSAKWLAHKCHPFGNHDWDHKWI